MLVQYHLELRDWHSGAKSLVDSVAELNSSRFCAMSIGDVSIYQHSAPIGKTRMLYPPIRAVRRSPSHIVKFPGESHPFIYMTQVAGTPPAAILRVDLRLPRARRSDASLQKAPTAAADLCSRCQRSSRFQQISAIFRPVATRALLLLERLRIRW